MSVTIVKAVPDDAAGIIAYMNTVGGETDNLTFGKEGFPMTVEEERRFLEAQAGSDRSVMLLAKKDGNIVGVSSFSGMFRMRMRHRGEVAISVLKAEWGQGIGSRLLEAAIDFARHTARAEIISLEVRSDNERAIRLYRKFGFETIGHFKGFFKIDGAYVDFDLMNLYL